jgi:hypothetical protein
LLHAGRLFAMQEMPMSLKTDRVRRHTAAVVLRRIDDTTVAHLLDCASGGNDSMAARLHELDREWDVDRAVEIETALTGLAGLALGVLVRPAILAVPAFGAAMLTLYALTGRHPLMPLWRRLGLRTAREIARERLALKVLRGDFAGLEPRERPAGVRAVGLHPAPEEAVASAVGISRVGEPVFPR